MQSSASPMAVVRCGPVRDVKTMTKYLNTNVFAQLPQSLPQELVEVLVNHPQVRIERIVSTGQASPAGFCYDQNEHEWVILLQGEAKLRWNDEQPPTHLQPGDHVLLPAHRKHRVQWTTPDQPTVWLAVFFG